MGLDEVSDQRLALCLSGGGLRATLFHLGVIEALRDLVIDGDMALKRVAEVYAVSGGSILAAHMLKNWSSYVSDDPREFAAVAQQIRNFAQRDIRNRVLRRSGLLGWFGKSRGFWLQREYQTDSLLGTVDLSACYTDKSIPTFHFLATNFGSGELCSFSGKHFEKTRREGDDRTTDRTPADNVRLAFAVAASSSFPPMFPPIPLRPDMLAWPEGDDFAMPIALSDGGVYDNFGIDKFRLTRRETPGPDLLIVSHAGGSFETDPTKSYSDMISRNIRASDIMMRRVGEDTIAQAKAAVGDGFVLVRIGEVDDDKTVQLTTQQMLRLVRTDLDRFEPRLCDLLIGHGRRIANKAFEDRGWRSRPEDAAEDEAKPSKARENVRLANVAKQAAERRYWALLFDFRDWVWLSLWWLLVAACSFGAVLGGKKYVEWKEAQRQELVGKAVKEKVDEVALAYQSGDRSRVERALGIALQTAERAADPAGTQNVISRRPDTALPPAVLLPGTAISPKAQGEVPTGHPQLVYIQFAGILTRGQIERLNGSLIAEGWRAQGESGERTPKAAGLNEVRFSGENAAAAQALCDAINRSNILAETVTPRKLSVIRSDTLEVWISR